MQVPSDPARLQALHVPEHGVSQHTPSAHVRPPPHSGVDEQPLPGGRLGTQADPLQWKPAAHSESAVQSVAHVGVDWLGSALQTAGAKGVQVAATCPAQLESSSTIVASH